jgi:hypothetical protein
MSEGDRSVYDQGVNARLSALEFLVEGLWAQGVAALPPEQAKNLLQSLQDAAGRWALTTGNPPQDVEVVQRDARVMEAYIGHMIDRIRATEQLVRRHQPSGKTP